MISIKLVSSPLLSESCKQACDECNGQRQLDHGYLEEGVVTNNKTWEGGGKRETEAAMEGEEKLCLQSKAQSDLLQTVESVWLVYRKQRETESRKKDDVVTEYQVGGVN